MEKMTFSYKLSEEQLRKKQAMVDVLLKNAYVKAWMKKNQVDEAFISDHSGKFSDWCEMKAKCEHCQGLAFCRQPSRGEQMELALDVILMNEVVPCHYAIKEKEALLHRRQYREMDMLEDYLLVNVGTLDVAKESNEYKLVVEKAIDVMTNEQSEKGLYLWGKPGAGKSYLAAGITNYYAKKNKSVAYVNVPKLIADLKMMFHSSEAMDRKLSRIKKADVVVLDDIGGESVTSWSRDDILLPLLDARMEKKKLTIFTSNYAMEDLRQRLSMTANKSNEPIAAERLLERIKALSCEIFVKGSTRRK